MSSGHADASPAREQALRWADRSIDESGARRDLAGSRRRLGPRKVRWRDRRVLGSEAAGRGLHAARAGACRRMAPARGIEASWSRWLRARRRAAMRGGSGRRRFGVERRPAVGALAGFVGGAGVGVALVEV